MARKKRSTASLYDFTNYTPTEEDKKAYERLQASYAPAPQEDTKVEDAEDVIPPVQEEPSFLDRVTTNAGAVLDAAQAGGYRDLSAVINRMRVSDNPIVAGAVAPVAGLVNAANLLATGEDPTNPNNDLLGGKSAVDILKQRAQENATSADAVLAPVVKEGGLTGFFARTAQDAAQSGLSSALSIVGGPAAGGIAGGVTYANAYAEAKDAGASDGDAEAYALTQGGIEGLVSSVQAARFIPGANRVLGLLQKKTTNTVLEKLASPTLRAGVNTMKTMLGEGTGETATGAAQDIVGAWVAGQMSSDDAKKTLGAQHSAEGFAERRQREFAAGALMGGAVAPLEVYNTRNEFNREINRRQAELPQGAVSRGLEAMATSRAPTEDSRRSNDIPVAQAPNQPTDLFPETLPGAYSQVPQPSVPSEQPSDSPLNDTRYASQRREMLRGFRDTEMDNIRTLEDQIDTDEMLKGTAAYGQEQAKRPDELADARRRLGKLNEEIALYEGGAAVQPSLGLNEPTQPKPKAPKPIQTRGGDKVIQPDGTVTSNVDEANRAQAKKLLEQEAKDDNKAIDGELKRRAALHQKNRTSFLSNVREENRGLPVDQRVEVLAQAARQWDASNPAPTREQVTLADALAAKQQSKPSGKKGGKGKSKWAPASPVTATPVTPASTATTEIGKRIESLANQVNQGMAMEEGTGKPTAPFDRAKYVRDTTQIVRNLVKSNDQKAIDILNLDQQGKLAFVPSPESVGLDMSDNTRAAFVNDDGKMYIFTDRVNPKDATATIIRGYHEATHAGQFNDRAKRKPVMRALLGDTKYGDAVSRVLAAAKSGNVVAKNALKATNSQLGDTAQTDTPELFQKELMGHFVGEVVRHRSKPLGSVAGIARDIMAGARNVVRKATGTDLDVSFNDIYSAVKGVGRELVATDVKGKQSGDVLAMIIPENLVSKEVMAEQEKAGRVYDSVNGQRKFQISDADSKINDDLRVRMLRKLRNGVDASTTLGELLEHPSLYEIAPSLKDVRVNFVNDLMGYPAMEVDGEIFISKKAAENMASGDMNSLRSSLLHEAQHVVQTNSGVGDQGFDSAKLTQAANKMNAALTANDNAASDFVDYINSINAKQADGAAIPTSVMQAVTTSTDRHSGKTHAEAIVAMDALSNAGIKLDAKGKQLAKKFATTLADYREARTNAIKTKADYFANISERESYRTQMDMDTPQSVLDARGNPENAMREQPSMANDSVAPEIDRAIRGRIDVPAVQGERKAAMAMEETTPPEITKRYVPAWVRGLFDATQGIGKIKNEIIERAMDSPAGDRMRAEATMGKYDAALIRQAAERGIEPKELNAEIEAAIQKLPDDLEGYDANISAFNKAMEKFGEAGEALKEMRDQIDALSLQMVEDRFASPIPLNASEQRLYKTILGNLGRYTNRQYAAYTGDAGREYANAVWSDYQKRKDSGEEMDAVTEANYAKVAKAVKVLVNDTLMIPDAEGLGNMSADRARRLYSTWVGNAQNVPLEDVKQALYDRRQEINRNSPVLEQRAEKIVKELLGLTKVAEPIVQYYRGAKLNTGILQKRARIAPEVRAVMGEITDPAMSMLMTTAKLAEFTSRTKMFLELSKEMGGDILPPGSIAPDNWTPLNEETYGPLQGYLVSPNMKAALADVSQIHATFEQAVAMAASNPTELGRKLIIEASDKWGNLARWSKTMRIVANPANFVYNLVGGPMIMLQNGNVNPKYFVQGLKDATKLISYASNPKIADASITALVENGVVDSAFIGEIKSEQYRELNALIKQMSGHEGNPSVVKAREVVSKLLATGREGYAMMDVMYKIANFHQQVAHLRSFYEAEGIAKTDEQLMREAASDVKRTNFTYRRAAPLVKAMESRGLSSFGPYMAEVFRTQVTNILQGIGEIQRAKQATTPEGARIMRMRGGMRVAGQLATYGVVTSAAHMLANAAFGDDDEREKYLRSLLHEYLRDQDFGVIGTDENGYPVFWQLSRFDPVGPATDLIRAVINGDDVGAEDVLKKVYDTYVAPAIGGQTLGLINAVAADKKPSRKPLAQQLAPEFYSDVVDIADKFGLERNTVLALTNIGETFMPGFMNSWRDTNARPSEDDITGSLARAASYAGFTFNSLDPAKPARFAALDLADASKKGRTRLSDYLKDNPDRTEVEVAAKILQQQVDEREAFEHVVKVYTAASALGYPTSELNSILRQNKLNLTQIGAVRRGEFKSSVVSKDSLKDAMKRELQDADPADRPDIRKKWKEIEKLVLSANRNVERGNE